MKMSSNKETFLQWNVLYAGITCLRAGAKLYLVGECHASAGGADIKHGLALSFNFLFVLARRQ